MFCLSLIEKDLRLPPHLLNLPLLDAVRGELERSFLDKVVPDFGLCVSIYDIRSIEGGVIPPGDGCPTYKVLFRLVMFRPFVGEVILGKIEDSNRKGVRISLGFFNDIYVPSHRILEPCSFNEADGIWSWIVGEGNELELAINEEVRFQVVSIKYPPIPVNQEEYETPFAPMEIVGSMDYDGLGATSWW